MAKMRFPILAPTAVIPMVTQIMHKERRNRFPLTEKYLHQFPLRRFLKEHFRIFPLRNHSMHPNDKPTPAQLEMKVPQATPVNPYPNGKPRKKLIAMFTILVAMAITIGKKVFCIPTNHPLMTIIVKRAGLPQILIEKYSFTNPFIDSSPPATNHRPLKINS